MLKNDEVKDHKARSFETFYFELTKLSVLYVSLTKGTNCHLISQICSTIQTQRALFLSQLCNTSLLEILEILPTHNNIPFCETDGFQSGQLEPTPFEKSQKTVSLVLKYSGIIILQTEYAFKFIMCSLDSVAFPL